MIHNNLGPILYTSLKIWKYIGRKFDDISSRFDSKHDCNRQTDRQTDRQTYDGYSTTVSTPSQDKKKTQNMLSL